jgi:predicted transcriptional regulator
MNRSGHVPALAALDTARFCPYSWGMEVNLNPDLLARLTRLAADRGSDADTLVQEAVERFVDYDEWFLREARKGLAAAERGEFIDHEDVGKLIDGRYRG